MKDATKNPDGLDIDASAVALAYDGKNAPRIVAKGHGELAQDIIATAKEHGILVHEDEELVKVLQRIELGSDIPKELYIIIAELIAFSYVLQGKFPEEWHNIHQRIDLKS